MANYQAKLDFIVSGQSNIDRLVSSASQLDSIVQNLSKSPLDINVQRATSQLDKFDTELKALKTNISNADKQIDTAVAGVSKYTTEIASLQSKLSQLNPNTAAYNKVLEKQNAAIKNLAQSQKDLAKAGADLESFEANLGKATKNVKAAEAAKRASEALSNLADDYLRVGRAQDRGVSGKVLKEQLEPTIAQLGAQAEVLKLVASNSRIASSEFNRFAIASQVAGQKIFEAKQKQLSAIAFGLSPSAPKVNIGTGGQSSIAAARNQVQELINLYPGIVKSEAALSDYSNQLKRLQSLVPYTSREFSVLENVIAELNDEIANIGLRGQKSAITLPREIKPSGPVSTREGTLKDRQDYAEAVNKEYQKQLDLIDKIDRSIIGISSKEEFLNQVYRANSELSEHNLEIAQKMTIEINRQVGKMVRSQKSGGTLVAGIFGQDFMPVSGRIPGTGIEPGSPADKQRTVKAKLSWQSALAQMDELAQQIKQTADAKGSKIKMDWNLALEKANETLSDVTIGNLQAGTKAATKLGQQRLKEIERTTADLWKGYGGPALPPGFTEKGRITPKATGQFSPIEGQRRLTNIVESGAIIQQGLINLQRKGADVTDRLVQLETALNSAKQDGYEISQRNLDVLNDEVASAGRFAQLQRQILAGQTGAGGRAGGKGKNGYETALTTEQARAKISEIVKDFNAAVNSNSDTQNIGGNIASSFAKNLKDGASSAASAATSFASAALAAIKKVFGIASPSRVMKEIAANLISSFIVELVSNIPSVKAALEQTFNPKSAYEQAGRAPARRPGMAMELDPRFVAALSGSPLPSGASTIAGTFEAGYTRPQGMGLYRMQQRRFPTDLPVELSSRRNRPSDTSKVISESIKEYRAAVDNFWDGEDSSFEAVKRIVVASARLSAARLSRTLQQSRANSFDQEFQQVADEARSIIGQQGRGAGNTRQAFQRISDSILNSVEAFAYTVSENFGSAIDRARSAIPRAVEGIASALDVSGYFGGRMGGGGGRPPAPPALPAGPSNDDLRRALTGGNLAPLARATSQQLGVLEEELTAVRNSVARTNPVFDQLTNQIQALGREQERRAPGATFLTRRVGPRAANAISEGLIGGAFPLLFGQGLGASVGGLAGGATGGFVGGGLGFGLSLIGTALGSIFDQLNKAAQDTGDALRYPSESFDKLKEAGLLASRQQEYYISKLIESGKIVQANAEIQKEITKKVGVSGAKDLTALGESSSRLSKTWAEFNLQLQAALAGPMADLLNWVNSIITDANKAGRETAALTDFMKQLTPKQQQQYIKQSIDLMNANNGVVDPQKLKALQQQFLPSGGQAAAAALSPEQKDAVARAQSETKQLQAQVELAGKRLSITGLTLEKDGARYVQLSKSIALQEYDNKLLEIRDSWIGKIFDKEKNIAMIRSANLEYAAKLKQIETEIAQNREQMYKNTLQAEAQLYNQQQEQIDILIKYAELDGGEEAAAEKRVELAKNIYFQKLAAFGVERDSAMLEAARNGTLEQTIKLYALKKNALENIQYIEDQIAKQKVAQRKFDKQMTIEQAKQQTDQPFIEFRKNQELSTQYAETYYKLLKQGIRPVEAQRTADFEKMTAQQKNSLDLQIAFAAASLNSAQKLGLSVDKINELKLNLESLQAARGQIDVQALIGPGPKLPEVNGLKIQEFISEATYELNNLELTAIAVSQSIGDAIGNSLNDGIAGLIEGTKTTKEIFNNFLKDVGRILIQEGTKMIATYIAIGLAKQFAGLLSGGITNGSIKGGNFGSFTGGNIGIGGVPDLPGLSSAGALPTGESIIPSYAGVKFASGGIVSSPTLFKFADGGTTKNGVMGEAGPEAIMPLRRGPDGRLGVEASGSSGSINVTVNVDASGSKVSGDNETGAQLGRSISAAVQQELIRQKRPGGLLS